MAIQSIGNIGNIGNIGSGAPASSAATQNIASVRQGASSPTPSQVQETSTKTAAPIQEQIQQAVSEIKQNIESKAPSSLAFSIDDTTGKTVIRVTDVSTGETIRQIPSEELLAISRSLSQSQGMLLRQQA